MAPPLTPFQLAYYLACPDDIEETRQRLFDGEPGSSLSFSETEWDLLWPFVSNVWNISGTDLKSRPVDSPFVKNDYRCAWYRVLDASLGKDKRAKVASTHASCGGAVRVIIESKVIDDEVSDEVVGVSTDLATPRCYREQKYTDYGKQVTLQFKTPHNDHTLEDRDLAKTNDAIIEAVRDYVAAFDLDIPRACKKFAEDETSLEILKRAGLRKGLQNQEVRNFCRQMKTNARNVGNHRNAAKLTWQEQVQEAGSKCDENAILWRHVAVDVVDKVKRCSQGFIFVPQAWCATLCENDFLVVLDSTHNTNHLRWYLFTLLVRDRCGRWRPGAHFLAETQHAAIIEGCIRAVRDVVPSFSPKYVVNDDSAAEQKAVRDFSASEAQSLLCQKHWKDVVFKNLPGKDLEKTRRLFMKALLVAIDEEECTRFCELAVNAIPNGK